MLGGVFDVTFAFFSWCRKTQKILESRDLEAKNLVDLLSSIRLECEFLKKEVQTTEREKENILVEFDTLKLDVRHGAPYPHQQVERKIDFSRCLSLPLSLVTPACVFCTSADERASPWSPQRRLSLPSCPSAQREAPAP